MELVVGDKSYHHQCKYFSTIDPKSAYHQIPLDEADRSYTAFEAGGGLWQFTVMPYGVMNGAVCFQHKMDELIEEEKLADTYTYLDNVTICGLTEEEHNSNLEKFRHAATKYDITFKEDKCIYCVTSLNILGYVVSHGEIKPDPERFGPLKKLPVPKTVKALQRVIGMFSYYSKWIPRFSEKIAPLVQSKTFPLVKRAEEAFNNLKLHIEHVHVGLP